MLDTASSPRGSLRHEEFVRHLREERAISLAEASAANDPAQPSLLPSRDFLRPTVSVPRPASIVSSQLATTLLERAEEAEERGAEPEPEEPEMDRFRREELAINDDRRSALRHWERVARELAPESLMILDRLPPHARKVLIRGRKTVFPRSPLRGDAFLDLLSRREIRPRTRRRPERRWACSSQRRLAS